MSTESSITRELCSIWLPESGYQSANSPSYDKYVRVPERNFDGIFVMDICLPLIPL